MDASIYPSSSGSHYSVNLLHIDPELWLPPSLSRHPELGDNFNLNETSRTFISFTAHYDRKMIYYTGPKVIDEIN